MNINPETLEEHKLMLRHRKKIYAAEISRLNGDKVYTQYELDKRIEKLLK